MSTLNRDSQDQQLWRARLSERVFSGSRSGWSSARDLLFLGCLVAALFSSGCSTTTSGYRISNETVAFIQPGVTTRAELVENLGPPLLVLHDMPVVAYSWGKVRMTGGKAPVQERMQPHHGTGYSVAPTAPEEPVGVESRRWLYCIALDEKERVTRQETIEIREAASLEQAVRDWAGQTVR
jgi:hypothetical protein